LWKSKNFKMKKIASLSLFLFANAVFLLAQSSLTRGPYLNIGTPESMTIRWRSAATEVGVVKYGVDYNNLTDSVVESQSKTEHIVKINGLQANTKYYYSIGANSTYYTANSQDYFFKTSPVVNSNQKVRAWLTGDFGNGSQQAIDVKNVFLQNYRDIDTDMWIWLGDNAYEQGTDLEFQNNLFDIYPEVLRNTVVWATPGNHEYGSIDLFNNGPYYDVYSSPRNGEAGGVASSNKAYFSYDYGNIHFLSLNSEFLPAIAVNNTAFIQWLKQDLQNTNKDWIIAFWHQSPYSKGTHDSDDDFGRPQLMRENVIPILEQYGVDMVFTGHSHGYERSYLINGHKGKSNTFDATTMLLDGSNGNAAQGKQYVKYIDGTNKNKGTVYAVVGCSGKKGSGTNPLNHPVMYMSTEDYYGSMVLDIEGLTLNATFIDKDGAILDEFSIVKQADPSSVFAKNYENTLNLNLYPNPFSENFNIDFSLKNAGKIEVIIKDIHGKIVDRVDEKHYEIGTHQIKYAPKKRVSNGIYLVEIIADKKLETKKIIKME
jgi:acid phosphatase type 7